MSMISVISGSGRSVSDAPTIGTATNVPSGRAYNNGRADVTFTAPAYTGRTPITGYTVTSSPSGLTGTGASSPISVTGLQSSTSYTFTVTATNAIGTSAASSASNSITATTVPQAPTIGTASSSAPSTASITFTAGATGGSAITGYTATSSPGSITGTGSSSPITVSGLTNGTAYTFTVTATNANGTSAASSASNSVTPVNPALGAWSISTNYPNAGNTITQAQGAGNTGLLWVGGGIYNGEIVIADGYKWNGSSWSSSNLNFEAYQQIVQRLTASSGTNSLMRLGGYQSGFSLSNKTAILNGNDNSWSAGSNFPVATYGVGFASLNGSGNVRTLGGSNLGGAYNYYQTSFGGGFTNSGVDSPFANNVYATGVDNNFGGEGWFWRQNAANTYKCTSITSAWTAMTSAPWGNIANSFFANQTVVGGTVMVAPQYNSSPIGGTIYTFNGTTYTAQTSLTAVPNWDYGVLGAVGNVVSWVRNTPTSNANENYHYRATFA